MKTLILKIAFLLQFNLIFATNYYVDGSVSISGNGLSWATAWKTIAEARNYNLQPGDVVYIKNGTYTEGLYLKKSGAEIIPVTTGISIISNKIYFPASTDLSVINLFANPGEYYLYVYRSWKSNNGVFKITNVNNTLHYVEVENPDFIDESGTIGDVYSLTACVGRPIIFKNGANNPQTERVIINFSSLSGTMATLGLFVYSGWDDADPVDFNIIDGIDLTGSPNDGGWHIQSSNFNVIMNCKIYNTGTVTLDNAAGILINGNQNRPAKYNMIINNDIYNTPYEGIYIGAGGHPQFNNYTFFNHIIGNVIRTSGSGPTAKMENAIDIKEWNYGNVVESNIIGDFTLSTTYNGALDINQDAHHTLAYNNIFKKITKGTANNIYYTIGIRENADYTYVFNNLIYNEATGSGQHYAFYLASDNNDNSYVAHNTVYNYARGILTASGGNNFYVANNIIDAQVPIYSWSGNFQFSNNLYTTTPNYYNNEPNRKIGNPNFYDVNNFDFRLTQQSTLAINNAITLNPPINLDLNLFGRTIPNDIGAYEYGSPLPVELVSFSANVKGESIILIWQTATEVNNFGFEIERKLKKASDFFSSWEKIGFVPGHGNSNSPKDYSFIDKNLSSGKVQYRLKQIDNDGTYSYSEEIEVEIGIPKEFKLYQNYPNPFNPITKIRYKLKDRGYVKLNVYDLKGERIMVLVNEEQEEGYYEVEFDVNKYQAGSMQSAIGNKLSSGIYLYRIEVLGEGNIPIFTKINKMVLLK